MLPAEASYGGGTRTRTACGLVAVVLGALWLLPAASAQSTEPPGLDRLWDEYPLAPPEREPPLESAPDEEPAPAAPPRATGDDRASAWLLALAALAAVLVLVAAAGVVARARRRPATLAARTETADDLIAAAYALATEAAECDTFLDGQRHEGSSVMTGTHDDDLSAPPDVTRQPTPSTYADIGERVAGVLAAAETAALQIREDARGSAEEILSLAREEADALRREAAAYDADTRAAVESYASDRRREVDQEVQRELADSEAQARATRQAAEAMARQIEDDARRRGQALRDESRAVEERLQKAAQGLRRMTAGIEELLGAPSVDGESLTDALKPHAQRPEVPVTAAREDER